MQKIDSVGFSLFINLMVPENYIHYLPKMVNFSGPEFFQVLTIFWVFPISDPKIFLSDFDML